MAKKTAAHIYTCLSYSTIYLEQITNTAVKLSKIYVHILNRRKSDMFFLAQYHHLTILFQWAGIVQSV